MDTTFKISDTEKQFLDRAIERADRGEFMPDEKVKEFFRKNAVNVDEEIDDGEIFSPSEEQKLEIQESLEQAKQRKFVPEEVIEKYFKENT